MRAETLGDRAVRVGGAGFHRMRFGMAVLIGLQGHQVAVNVGDKSDAHRGIAGGVAGLAEGQSSARISTPAVHFAVQHLDLCC